MTNLKTILTKLDEVSSFVFDGKEIWGATNHIYGIIPWSSLEFLHEWKFNYLYISSDKPRRQYTLSDYTEDELVQQIKKDFKL